MRTSRGSAGQPPLRRRFAFGFGRAACGPPPPMTGRPASATLRGMEAMSRSDAIARLADLRAAYAAIRPRVVAGAPWPLADDFGTGPEASWGPPEVLAHLAEMLSYWYGQYGIIAQAGRGAGEGVPFGRTSDDPVRVAVLERDRRFPMDDLFDLVDDGIARWERRMASATDDGGSAVGAHPRLGEMTADRLRDRMVVSHLEEHLAQLESALASR